VQVQLLVSISGQNLTIADHKAAGRCCLRDRAEVFVLDAGWYNKKDWSRELGDYEAIPWASVAASPNWARIEVEGHESVSGPRLKTSAQALSLPPASGLVPGR